MSNPIRILSISDDDGLRLSRELLLINDGYETESIASNMALSVGRARSFDIALICRSVEPERAMILADMLRRYNPDIQILCSSPLENRIEFAVGPEIPSGPEALLDAIREFCKQKPVRQDPSMLSHSLR
jgi:hypothetical protein